jgi:hypothetical protein
MCAPSLQPAACPLPACLCLAACLFVDFPRTEPICPTALTPASPPSCPWHRCTCPASCRYVDNLQTVKTSTLHSLQQLPPHLRRLLTRSLLLAPGAAAPPAPGGAGGPAGAASSAAAAAGAMAAAFSAGATSALAATRRSTASAGASPTKRPMQRQASGQQRQLAPWVVGPSDVPLAWEGSNAPGQTSVLPGGLLSLDKPPVPRRAPSSRLDASGWQAAASDSVRQPLLHPEQQSNSNAAGQAQRRQREMADGSDLV